MRHIQKILSAVVVSGIAAVGTIAGNSAKAADAISVLLCPFGCGPIAGDTVLMNQMIKSGADVMILPQETPGYMYNIREMAQNKSQVEAHHLCDRRHADPGRLRWRQRGHEGVSARTGQGAVETACTVKHGGGRASSLPPLTVGLKSMADLKGKRISLGLRGQSDWGVFSRLFLKDLYGITPENTDIRHMTPGQLTQQLIDGATDASVTPIGAEPTLTNFLIPGPVRQLEATGKPICYLGVTPEEVKKMNDKYGATWLHVKLPPNTLPNQTEPLGIGFNRAFKASHESFDEDLAYKLVKIRCRDRTEDEGAQSAVEDLVPGTDDLRPFRRQYAHPWRHPGLQGTGHCGICTTSANR